MYEQPKVVADNLAVLKETGEKQFTEIYTDDYGTWITMMYPIFDEQKNLVNSG